MLDLFNNPEDNIERVSKLLLNDKRLSKKLLLGRENVQELSVLERILSNGQFYQILDKLWNKFNLGRNPVYLLLVRWIYNNKGSETRRYTAKYHQVPYKYRLFI